MLVPGWQVKLLKNQVSPAKTGCGTPTEEYCDPLRDLVCLLVKGDEFALPQIDSAAVFVLEDSGRSAQMLACAGDHNPEAIRAMRSACTSRINPGGRLHIYQSSSYPVSLAISFHQTIDILDLAPVQASLEEACRLSKLFDPSALAQKSHKRLEAFYAIGQTIHQLDTGGLLQRICELTTQTLEADACSLMLLDGDTLVMEASTGTETNNIRIPKGHAIAWSVMESGAAHLLNEAPGREIGDMEIGTRPEIQSSLCVPLVSPEGSTLGVMAARRKAPSPEFGQDDLRLFTLFAQQAALAITNSRLYSELKERVNELGQITTELATAQSLNQKLATVTTREQAVHCLLEAALQVPGCRSSAFGIIHSSTGAHLIFSTLHQDPDMAPSWYCLDGLDAGGEFDVVRKWNREQLYSRGISFQAQEEFSPVNQQVLVSLPLKDGQDISGILWLLLEENTDGQEQGIRILDLVSTSAGSALAKIERYEQAVSSKALEISAVCALTNRVSSAINLDEALEGILETVTNLVDCDVLSLWRASGNGLNELIPLTRKSIPDPDLDLSQKLAAWALAEGKAGAWSDLSHLANEAIATQTHTRSGMAIPLQIGEQTEGVLVLGSGQPGYFSDDHLQLLSVVTSQAAAIYKGLRDLRELSLYTENILSSVAAGVVALDADGIITTWNRAAEEITGTPADSAKGSGALETLGPLLAFPCEVDKLNEALNLATAGIKQDSLHFVLETPHDRPHIHLQMSLSPLIGPGESRIGTVVVFEDVSRQVQMQDEVRRMGELAAIGQLAASIAHEIRNPLSSIKGSAQFLQLEASEESTREFLGIILEEVENLNTIASSFLDFAKPIKLETEEINLEDLIRKQINRVKTQLEDQHIEAEIINPNGRMTIVADETQLSQALLNLFLNAIQAMAGGGHIWIDLGESSRWKDHVEITIRDNGPGIAPERLSRIFIPFFTTKVKGTGLGLAVVQKIIQNHQGHIEVESHEGQGALFRIHLPIGGPKPALLEEGEFQTPDLMERK